MLSISALMPNIVTNQFGTQFIPSFPNYDGVFSIKGDSMQPHFRSGDIVFFKQLADAGNILWGEAYIVKIEFGGDEHILTRFVRKSVTEGKVLLCSANADTCPTEIAMSAIKAIAQIKGCFHFTGGI